MAESEKKMSCCRAVKESYEESFSPLVSVVVPVYNVENYLQECLDSVVNQTYKNLEIIIVDDGSTDSSGHICNEYEAQDERIHVIHKSNGGLGNARNVGMDSARGKYIIFLDSDDYWDLNAIEVLCRIAEEDQLQLLVFSAEPFWDGMKRPKNFLDYGHDIQNDIVQNGTKSLRLALDNHEYYASTCLRFYLLSYLMQNGLRFDEGTIHEDLSFSFLGYLLADRVECIADRIYKRRYRPASIMTTRSLEQSAQGYANALYTLLTHYQERAFSGDEHQLYIRYMKKLLQEIRTIYSRAVSEDKKRQDYSFKTARTIDKKIRGYLRYARVMNPYLEITDRLATYSLSVAWCVSKTRECIDLHPL